MTICSVQYQYLMKIETALGQGPFGQMWFFNYYCMFMVVWHSGVFLNSLWGKRSGRWTFSFCWWLLKEIRLRLLSLFLGQLNRSHLYHEKAFDLCSSSHANYCLILLISSKLSSKQQASKLTCADQPSVSPVVVAVKDWLKLPLFLWPFSCAFNSSQTQRN